jgi:hypothetical protein
MAKPPWLMTSTAIGNPSFDAIELAPNRRLEVDRNRAPRSLTRGLGKLVGNFWTDLETTGTYPGPDGGPDRWMSRLVHCFSQFGDDAGNDTPPTGMGHTDSVV